jgi:hypothetical protein
MDDLYKVTFSCVSVVLNSLCRNWFWSRSLLSSLF